MCDTLLKPCPVCVGALTLCTIEEANADVTVNLTHLGTGRITSLPVTSGIAGEIVLNDIGEYEFAETRYRLTIEDEGEQLLFTVEEQTETASAILPFVRIYDEDDLCKGFDTYTLTVK